MDNESKSASIFNPFWLHFWALEEVFFEEVSRIVTRRPFGGSVVDLGRSFKGFGVVWGEFWDDFRKIWEVFSESEYLLSICSTTMPTLVSVPTSQVTSKFLNQAHLRTENIQWAWITTDSDSSQDSTAHVQWHAPSTLGGFWIRNLESKSNQNCVLCLVPLFLLINRFCVD